MPHLSAIHPVIELVFDPITRAGEWNVRIQTLVLGLAILAALLVAARIARRTPVVVTRSPDDRIAPDAPEDGGPQPNHLRRDDLLYIVVAALPGAVLGGRLGYWLLHLDYYTSNPGAILDIGQGGFQLSLAVLGGILSAAVVASLLGTPVGRWLHAAILPLLLAIAGGKLAMALGGEGQGLPWDGPWATAYLGPGPWLSLAPEIPSHPSQVYEALATLVVLAVLAMALAAGGFARRAGGAFLLGMALWGIARLLVAFTWRDPAVLGPFRADQLLSLGIIGGSVVLLAAAARHSRAAHDDGGPDGAEADARRRATLRAERARAASTADPEWPDPGTRPGI